MGQGEGHRYRHESRTAGSYFFRILPGQSKQQRSGRRYRPGSCSQQKAGGTAWRQHWLFQRARRRFHLLVYAADKNANHLKRSRKHNVESKQATILIVDDNKINRTILHDLISVIGHKPILAEDGETALTRIFQKPHPDMILLDIMMPGIDGYEVLDKVKEDKFLRLLPVIMITAVDDIESQIRCIEKGADDYIIKPFNSILLKARIDALLEKKRLYEQEQQFNLWLAESYQKLQKAEAARDSLFHMIVHDLNNPITIIMGQAQILQMMSTRQQLTPEKVQATTGTIVTAAEQINGLAKQILDVAGLEEHKMPVKSEEFDLSILMDEINSIYAAQLESVGGVLEVEIDGPVNIMADRRLVQRILQNLLANSLKFTKPNTTPHIILRAGTEQNNVVISVTDNGPGIAGKFHETVFSRFFKV
ncbi:MAG: response regulator, partial [Desulfobulbaceae bacterium]|nr:response regulator [Desulfobulbaceae bacterium]